MYSRLEKFLNRRGSDIEIERTFREILEIAFQIVNEKFEKGEKFNLGDIDQLLALRAMYEYMMELWAGREWEEAKEVGFDLAYLTDDKPLREMFSLMVIGILAQIPLEKFMREYLITDTEPYLGYFFTQFTPKIDPLIEKYRERFQREFSEGASSDS